MTDNDVIAVISLDAPPSDALPPLLPQCSRCGCVIENRVCEVCPAEGSRREHDPLETERYRSQIRRRDRLNSLRPGERI